MRRFEPPHRLALDWFPGTGHAHPTFVEIEFEPIAGVDPVPNRAAAFVEPVHLAQSPFYQYRGTFWPAN